MAVGSLRSPGAKVPALRACCGSPAMDAICLANSRVTALLLAAALGEAGSYNHRWLIIRLRGSDAAINVPDAGKQRQLRDSSP